MTPHPGHDFPMRSFFEKNLIMGVTNRVYLCLEGKDIDYAPF